MDSDVGGNPLDRVPSDTPNESDETTPQPTNEGVTIAYVNKVTLPDVQHD